ncbi:DNA-J related domain-containing protein [Vibrio sp. HN007]|uniref:DNA-J related domain-containing protein n=1 Tax=Vibrio iocasae TaxID=3098914 RepID=UPI0035D48BF6
MDNPLIWPILKILRTENFDSQKQSWKVHEIMSKLSEAGLLPKLDANQEKDLFKRNFLIMNALYQLQSLLSESEYLQVQSMDIRLIEAEVYTENKIDKHDPLKSYYTDWNNYETSEQEIQQLFDDFWDRYTRYISLATTNYSRLEALSVFGLSPDASYLEIKKKWREMALKWHPDREDGCEKQFRSYCEAWAVLREKKE